MKEGTLTLPVYRIAAGAVSLGSLSSDWRRRTGFWTRGGSPYLSNPSRGSTASATAPQRHSAQQIIRLPADGERLFGRGQPMDDLAQKRMSAS